MISSLVQLSLIILVITTAMDTFGLLIDKFGILLITIWLVKSTRAKGIRQLYSCFKILKWLTFLIIPSPPDSEMKVKLTTQTVSSIALSNFWMLTMLMECCTSKEQNSERGNDNGIEEEANTSSRRCYITEIHRRDGRYIETKIHRLNANAVSFFAWYATYSMVCDSSINIQRRAKE